MRQSIGTALAGVAGLLLIFISAQAYGQTLDYGIKLTTQAGGVLNPHLDYGRNCHPPNYAGCMSFAKGTIGVIEFSLPHPANKLTCAEPGVQKVITEIEVTVTELVDPLNPPPPRSKGDFTGGIDGTWLKTYAFPYADSNGFIYKVTNKDQGLARVAVVNMNSHPPALGTQSFWYRVKAEACSGNATWETDPRGDNEGLH